MAKKITTLYIDDNSIRLMVSRGSQIKKWAIIPLEPGQIDSLVVMDEDAVAEKIRQLLEREKVKANKVCLGLSALHCLTRSITLPHLPKAILTDAITREARRTLPLPLEQVYMSWNLMQLLDDKVKVFLVAIRRNSIDTLFSMLNKAGLTPYDVDIKPLALSRLVKEPNAILLDIQSTEFDIVIMADGIPQPIRVVSFPSEAETWEEKLPTVISDLDKTIRFYNANNSENPLDDTVPLYISGEVPVDSEIYKTLADTFPYPVSPLTTPLDFPFWLDPGNYQVNAGLALKDRSLHKIAGPSLANVNLLPTEYQPKPISWGKVILVPTTVALTGVAVAVLLLMSSTSSSMALTSDQLIITSQFLGEKQMQKRELNQNIAELESKISNLDTSRQTIAGVLNTIDVLGGETNDDLKAIVSNIPINVYLSKINFEDTTFTVAGRAGNETDSLLYATCLDETNRFAQVIVSNIRQTEDNRYDFILTLIK